ncbi:hypothetical protein AVEN_28814-1 [Araneus ventricosus]|uniref:Uncharacterized protein n=1 Tax=Araneus ventricosus TaxID=182803 RepID=A0A4Y2PTW5_ARAVE|nr:hypothetical protein AVEN_28814-1 [Araneus ventricosus]
MFLFDFVFLGSAQRGPSPKCPGGLLKCSGVSEELSPRQHSEIEVGVLTDITGHGPTPSEGGASRHRSGGNSTLLYLQEKRESACLSGGFSSMYSWWASQGTMT